MNFIPKIEYGTGPTVITFELPPEGDNLDEIKKANATTTVSTAGVQQTQWNYNEHTISPNFVFVSQAIKDQLETFYVNWASKGKEFKYFESYDEATFWTVTLSKNEFKPKKVVRDGTSTDFIWDINIDMRRTL